MTDPDTCPRCTRRRSASAGCPTECSDYSEPRHLTELRAMLADLTPDEDRALAVKAEVAVSTVDRWRRGVARPHEMFCRFLVKTAEHIKEDRVKQVTQERAPRLTTAEIAELESLWRPVRDMHAERFSPDKPSNLQRLECFLLSEDRMDLLLAEIAEHRALCARIVEQFDEGTLEVEHALVERGNPIDGYDYDVICGDDHDACTRETCPAIWIVNDAARVLQEAK